MQKIETGFSELLHKQPETETQKDAYIHELQNAVQVLLDEVRNLDEMVALLRKKQFGSSSEKTPVAEEEPLGLFTEAEAEYQPDASEPYKKDKRGVHRKNQEDKWKLEKPENTENRIHDLDPEEQICPQCGGRLNRMGKELEEFFYSDEYRMYCNIDPDKLIKNCHMTAIEDEKKAISRRNKRKIKEQLKEKKEEQAHETGKSIV